MIDKEQPEGRYCVQSSDHNHWMMVERQAGKLVYWTTPGIIKDLSAFEGEMKILSKLNPGSMIRKARYAMEWGDGNLIDYRIESSSRSHFANLITGLYRPVYDALDDITRKRKIY